MNAIIVNLLRSGASALGRMIVAALASLVTEKLLRSALVIGLEKLAKKTDTDIDDRLLSVIKGESHEVSKSPDPVPVPDDTSSGHN